MVVKTDTAEIAAMTHRDLPCEDGEIVTNLLQAPQLAILGSSLNPWLAANHPAGDAVIGMDAGIYFMPTTPVMAGCRAPDFFYVPGVRPVDADGDAIFSYVMWQHGYASPYFLVELVSQTEGGELDDTPETGKFWIYERRVRAEYYVVFDAFRDEELSVFHLENGRYRQMAPNAAGRYLIPRFGYELGVSHETHEFKPGPYLRFFTADGAKVPTGEERAEAEKTRAEAERGRADDNDRQYQALLEKLKAKGIDPNSL